MVRIPGVCCFDEATTVLAHVNGGKSLSSKNADLLAAWACYECHRAIDRFAHMDLDYDYVLKCHLEGVMRTQRELIREGIVSW